MQAQRHKLEDFKFDHFGRADGFTVTVTLPIARPSSVAVIVARVAAATFLAVKWEDSVLLSTPITIVPYQGIVNAISPHMKLRRSYQWNVAVEKPFRDAQAVTVTYLGQAGRDQLRTEGLGMPANFTGTFCKILRQRFASAVVEFGSGTSPILGPEISSGSQT